MIFPRGGGLIADIAGFTVPVQQQGKALSFELPDGNGNFRGVRSASIVEGQWIQRATSENGIAYATPVILRADRHGGWRGEIVPLDDHMTYYLPLTREGDGRYATHLRNPERIRASSSARPGSNRTTPACAWSELAGAPSKNR